MASAVSGRKWAAAIAACGLLFAIYAFFDPETSWWMPKCPVHMLTGLECPGCGSQRALHALLHGDIKEAFARNALLFVMVPFLCLLAFAEARRNRHPRLFRTLYHPAVIITVVAVVIGWGIARNIWLR